MNCPLCDNSSNRPAWINATVYRGKVFNYRECDSCASIFTSPMPDDADLAQMYGDEYADFLDLETAHSGDLGIRDVLSEITDIEKGAFLDYGCGAGALLAAVAKTGWRAVGIDFDRGFTDGLKEQGAFSVFSDLNAMPEAIEFDVVHFGDVLEHITDVNREVPPILGRLKPGGRVIAQGPLEANHNLFYSAIRLKNRLSPSQSKVPPYHVSLATREGQKRFFSRFGLEERVFRVFETSHPAPSRIAAGDIRRARTLGLFVLRKLSQATTTILDRGRGNRYFYVGKKPN
jgi:SAM-dependent methyltransferase